MSRPAVSVQANGEGCARNLAGREETSVNIRQPDNSRFLAIIGLAPQNFAVSGGSMSADRVISLEHDFGESL